MHLKSNDCANEIFNLKQEGVALDKFLKRIQASVFKDKNTVTLTLRKHPLLGSAWEKVS